MSIYIATFITSSTLMYFSSNIKSKNKKSFLALIALLIPAVLAGLRASTIGTDVRVYVIYYFDRALNSSNFMDYYAAQSGSFLSEVGYHLLTYLLSRVFHDYHWALFFYQLIPLVFIYLGLKRCERLFQTPVWLGMLLYYFMLYNNSLNIMRQCIAVGCVFYATTFLFEKKYKFYLLYTIVAILFHTSSIISFAILPMYLLLCQGKKISLHRQIQQGSIFILALFIILIAGGKIIELLIDYGIIRAYYLEYLSGGKFRSDNGIPYVIVFGNILYTAILMIFKKYADRRNYESLFIIMSSCIVAIASYSVSFIQYIDRMTYFFIPIQIIGLANVTNCFSKASRKKYICLLVLLVFVFWYYSIVIKRSHETVPYTFFFS